MALLKPVWMLIQSLLVLAVFTLATDKHINNGAGLDYIIPETIPLLTAIGVFGISIFLALFHIVGGCLFGMAAGGVWDGMKLGGILGIGMGVSRLWPYALAWSAGVFAGEGPLLNIIVCALFGAILYGLSQFVNYFWSNLHQGG